uniref:uncharacterized protein LOC120339691 n=1 Tax=Styela clava TaxID=7725 RepID=UPI001939D96B|nr:uncharacterized protein LOC120339691 [Styela clava]XP_039263804.1 uncharacterized protein LOC120339691 [Styela clava]XP_039263805.1 uncharacterized protein LOC120339691 [Styela clava]XP_039263806.1 uncharacterized protein LOC120339691 [Styela clava]
MDFSPNAALSIPCVVVHIFSYLPIRDLVKQQRVCKLWKQCSEQILFERSQFGKIEILTLIKIQQRYNSEDEYEDWSSNTGDDFFKDDFMRWREKWRIIPSLLMCASYLPDSSALKLEKQWLPKNCIALVFETAGTICIDGEKSQIEDDLDIVDVSTSHNLIALANDIQTNVLYLKTGGGKESRDLFLSKFKTILTNEATKFVLVIASSRFENLKTLENDINSATEKGIVILGCSSCESLLLLCPDEHVKTDIIAVSLEGSSIKAASTYISENDIGEELTVTKLYDCILSLKNVIDKFFESCPAHVNNLDELGFCKLCHSQTIGFIIMTPRSKQEWYEEYDENPRPICFNQEQDAFRAIFPNVPLFGSYGEGIIGGSINIPNAKNHSIFTDPEVFAMCFGVLVLS